MIPQQFHDCHGRNVQLSESRLAAKRVSSYNQGLVLGTRPLARGAIFQVCLSVSMEHFFFFFMKHVLIVNSSFDIA